MLDSVSEHNVLRAVYHTAASLKVAVLWCVTPCGLVEK